MPDDTVALPAGARRYEVGGAVRDALLGRPVSDRDWVVVGATPQAMVAAGFRPVGRDFPVFLHPRTHEEHALARTERKTAPGYHGFVFHAAADVTLEQDLARRDLTVNAMARDEAGRLVDPHGGARDLRERVLRHVSPAFAEDPVRILRLARFAARFADFGVAPETAALMRAMVDAGEVDALVAERVWQEVARGLMEARPSRMLAVLDGCGALARLLPTPRPAAPVTPATASAALDAAAALQAPLPVRFALLADALAPSAAGADALATHWRVDGEARDRAVLLAREGGSLGASRAWDAAALTAFLDRCDAWRRPSRVRDLVLAERARTRGAVAGTASACPDGVGAIDQAGTRMLQALAAASAVDTGDAAREAAASGARGSAIGAAVLARRGRAVHTAITSLSRQG